MRKKHEPSQAGNSLNPELKDLATRLSESTSEATAVEVISEEPPSEETTPEKTTPEETTREETTPEETTPEETTPEETASEETASEETASEETASEETASEETVSVGHNNELTASEEKIKKISEARQPNISKFKSLSGIVKSGTERFVEIGLALQSINRNKYWKDAGHSSWGIYCRSECGFSKTHANRLILSAKIATYLTKQKREGIAAEHMKPRAESQVRPIGKVSKEFWLDVWCQAIANVGGLPTQMDVAAVVELMFGPEGTVKPKNPTLKEIVKDVVLRLRLMIEENGPPKEFEELVAELEEAVKLKRPVDVSKKNSTD